MVRGSAPGDPVRNGSPGDGGPPSRQELDEVSLRVIVSGRRADVVLDDPRRHNPQTPATWRALVRLAQWLDGRVDVVVLRAVGPSFSAGLDRSALDPSSPDGVAHLATLPQAAAAATIATYQEAFWRWSSSSFVSIAAVHGHAIGAGCQLALACDLRVAAEDVQFAVREPALGLVPDLGGTGALVAILGYARALEICATGRAVGAEEALRHGVVQQVVPRADLLAAVDAMAAPFLGEHCAAVLATRDLLRRVVETSVGSGADSGQLAAERAAQVRRIAALAAQRRGESTEGPGQREV